MSHDKAVMEQGAESVAGKVFFGGMAAAFFALRLSSWIFLLKRMAMQKNDPAVWRQRPQPQYLAARMQCDAMPHAICAVTSEIRWMPIGRELFDGDSWAA